MYIINENQLITQEDILDYVENYRNTHNVTYNGLLTEVDYKSFIGELQNLISRMDYTIKGDSKLIPYSGTYAEIPAWQIAWAMSSNDGYVYISNFDAGLLINDRAFIELLNNTIGGDNDATAIVEDLTGGQNNYTSQYALDDILSLNDFVSKTVMEKCARGDLQPLIFETNIEKVFFRTELPALLENPEVNSLWGISRTEIIDMLNNYESYGFSTKEAAVEGISEIFHLNTMSYLDSIEVNYIFNVDARPQIVSIDATSVDGGVHTFIEGAVATGSKTIGEAVEGFKSDIELRNSYPELAKILDVKPEYKIYAKYMDKWIAHPGQRMAIADKLSKFESNYKNLAKMSEIVQKSNKALQVLGVIGVSTSLCVTTFRAIEQYEQGNYIEGNKVLSSWCSRVCLKIAFCQIYVTLCGRFGPDEGGVVGYAD